MSVVLNGPPRPASHLRLVSSSVEPSAPPSHWRDRASLGGPSRKLHRTVLAWSLAQGAPVDPNALRVVLAVRQGLYPPDRLGYFTMNTVWALFFVEIDRWCRTRKLPAPVGVGRAVRALIEYLHTSGQLHGQSDEVEALHRAVDECTGGEDTPRPGQSQRSSLRSPRGTGPF